MPARQAIGFCVHGANLATLCKQTKERSKKIQLTLKKTTFSRGIYK